MTTTAITTADVKVGDRIVVKPRNSRRQRFAVLVKQVERFEGSDSIVVWGSRLYVDNPMIGNRGQSYCKHIRSDWSIVRLEVAS